jgi:hypothetical protein
MAVPYAQSLPRPKPALSVAGVSKGYGICTAIVVIIDAAGTALLQVFSIFAERNVPGGLPPSPPIKSGLRFLVCCCTLVAAPVK